MTIPSNSQTFSQYVGNNTAATYDYQFKITSDADLLVTVADTSGGVVTLSLSTDYTVTGVRNNAGGSITLVAGNLATDYILTIADNLDIEQPTPYGNQSSYFGEKHEDSFDRLTRLVQRVNGLMTNNRHVRLSDSDELIDLELPLVPGRAEKFLGFDVNGDMVFTVAVDTAVLTGELIGGYLYPRSQAEIDAGLLDQPGVIGQVAYKQYAHGDVRRYGAVGDGVTDSTAAIQAAINVASHGMGDRIRIPAGHYVYDTLYCFYEATLNSGFSQVSGRHGKMQLKGDGQLSGSGLKNWPLTYPYGTILESTGEGFIVAANRTVNGVVIAHYKGPYPARRFMAFDITFIANNTTYVFENSQCPLIKLTRCSFLQMNAAGNGLLMRSSWYMLMDECWVKGQGAGNGVTTGADEGIGQGDLTIQGGSIDNWENCIEHEEQYFANYKIADVALQTYTNAAVFVSGGNLVNLTLDNVHFEGAVSHPYDVRIAGTYVGTLSLVRCSFGPGSTTVKYTQTAVVSAEALNTIWMQGCYFFRAWCTVLDVVSCNTTSIQGCCEGNIINHDAVANLPAPIYLFTGRVPELRNNIYTGSGFGPYEPDGNYRLFDPDGNQPLSLKDHAGNAQTINNLAMGRVNVLTGVSGTINMVIEGKNRTIQDITNTAATSMYMPNNYKFHDGQVYYIKNNAASLGNLLLRNGNFQTIATIVPGALCITVLNIYNTQRLFIATAWAATTPYVVSDTVSNAGEEYICVTAGTSAGAGGPTGTTDGQADNTCVWDYKKPTPQFMVLQNA